MATVVSAGLLMYRVRDGHLEVLLVHPGGPYWAKKDRGAWSIPKGQVEEGEDLLAAAQREFTEETGIVPHGPFAPLGEVKYKGAKVVHGWAFAGDCDPSALVSVTYTMEWPPHSGQMQEYPEADRGAFFSLPAAREAILPAQREFLDRLATLVGDSGAASLAQSEGRTPTRTPTRDERSPGAPA